MDVLFATALGETAVVQTRDCDDAAKGKGVYALVHLAEGDVALRDAPCALLRAVDLTAAALEDVDESPPPPYETCETLSLIHI